MRARYWAIVVLLFVWPLLAACAVVEFSSGGWLAKVAPFPETEGIEEVLLDDPPVTMERPKLRPKVESECP